jgi:hypothetical protein
MAIEKLVVGRPPTPRQDRKNTLNVKLSDAEVEVLRQLTQLDGHGWKPGRYLSETVGAWLTAVHESGELPQPQATQEALPEVS